MTQPTRPGRRPEGPSDSYVRNLVSEEDDQAHYFFAPFVVVTDDRGQQSYTPALFGAGGYGTSYVDLRDPAELAAGEGYAFVRSPFDLATILRDAGLAQAPEGVFYVGQSLLGPLPTAARSEVRRRLNIRGQVTDVKSVLRFMLLTEAGESGKPGQLQPDLSGGLHIYLGDLRVDLTDGQ